MVSYGQSESNNSSDNSPVTPEQRSNLFTGAIQDYASLMPNTFQFNPTTPEPIQANYVNPNDYTTDMYRWRNSANYGMTAPEYKPAETVSGIDQNAYDMAANASKNPVGYNAPGYVAPGDAAAGSTAGSAGTSRLSQGDYNRLEGALLESRNTQLGTGVDRRNADINQEMADRGLWSSGMPIQQQGKEFRDTFAPLYLQAAADATAQRYGLEQADNSSANQVSIANAQNATQTGIANMNAQNEYTKFANSQQNQFNQNNAQNQLQAALANQNNELARASLLGNMTMQNAQMQNTANVANAQNQYQSQWAPLNFLQQLYGGTNGTNSSSVGNTNAYDGSVYSNYSGGGGAAK